MGLSTITPAVSTTATVVSDRWPGYYFWLPLCGRSTRPIVPFAGTLSLRIGHDADLLRHWGHVGYGVFPPARGWRYAERGVRLVMPLAKRHGLRELWITTNPDNLASRRTCERLGATLAETVDVPADHPLWLKRRAAEVPVSTRPLTPGIVLPRWRHDAAAGGGSCCCWPA